jgi:hypothetical protein
MFVDFLRAGLPRSSRDVIEAEWHQAADPLEVKELHQVLEDTLHSGEKLKSTSRDNGVPTAADRLDKVRSPA